MVRRGIGSVFVCALFFVLVSSGAASQERGIQWVGTWASAPMLADGGWAAKPLASVTLREIVHVSVGGAKIRIRFTNEFGTNPLTISSVYAAVSTGKSEIDAATSKPVTFNGAKTVRIPSGAAIYSDPIALSVKPLSDVAISFYIPSQVMRSETYHPFADQDNFLANGDVAMQASMTGAQTITSWYFISAVEVPAQVNSRAIVAFGDSITDGASSTRNANRRWPDVLAARLQQSEKLNEVSVLNLGIGGNRVLNDGAGPNAQARLYRDVLSQSGVRYLVVLESINDIGHLFRTSGPDDEITADQLKLGLAQIADAAHQHGIKVYGATLTPYGGAGYSSEKGEAIREEVNEWIRNSGTFDAVIDFDKVTSDPQNPLRFNPLYDSGDHLHPNDAGYKAMGEAIDLKLFE